MMYWIQVNVIQMGEKIPLVADCVLPEPALPDGLLAFFAAAL